MVRKILALIAFIILMGFLSPYFLPLGEKLLSKYQSNENLISPWINQGRSASNLWLPKILTNFKENELSLTASSAYFVDLDSGDVLYQKSPHEKLPIASLTKIMTAIVALENLSWNSEVLISPEAAGMEADHMLLIAGEKLSVEELMYGIFLVSANDAAEALAESTFQNPNARDRFIDQMNIKALELGMKDSLFINPTGLQEDGREQYSSALDVAIMSRYLIKNFPHSVDISSTSHIILPRTATHQDYNMYSGINLLTTYPGVLGLKTGYTPEAGLTLVTLAKKGGRTVLGVLLNSEDRRNEARLLLDYSLKKLGV